VGGDYLGQGPVPNADITVVDEASTINADATGNGDGGRVIVWSDVTSRIAGAITARGGVLGGDGGFVETSSAGFLDVDGAPDVSAFVGSGGTWLIDPSNIEIGDFGGTSTGISGSLPFTVSGATAQLDIADLIAALTGGADVTVTTAGSPGAGDGDITLSAALDFDGAGSNSLTLNADNQVIINAPILDSDALTPDSLNLTFRGTVDFGRDFGVIINNAISTNGGAFTTASDTTGVDVNAAIQTDGGDINLIARGNATGDGRGIEIDGAIRSSGGDITIDGRTEDGVGAAGLTINAEVDPAGGLINLIGQNGGFNSGPGLVLNNPIQLNGEDLLLQGFVDFGDNFGIVINNTIDTNGGSLTTANATTGVDVNAAIQTDGGDINLIARGTGTGDGRGIEIDGAIRSSGGDITIDGRTEDGVGAAGLTINAEVDPAGGLINLIGQNGGFNSGPGLVLNNPIQLNGEDLLLQGFVDFGDNFGIVINNTIDTNGGSLTTANATTGVDVNAAIQTDGGDINLIARGNATGDGRGIEIDGAIRSSGGDITIDGRTEDGVGAAGLTINAEVDPAGGLINLIGQNGGFNSGPGLVLNNPIQLNGEDLLLQGFVDFGDNFGIVINNTIDTNGGSLTTANATTGVDVNAAIQTDGGDINLIARGTGTGDGRGIIVDGFVSASGGNVTVTSLTDTGTIEILGALSTTNGAEIALTSLRNLDAGNITNPGGNINIISQEGAVTTGLIDTSILQGSTGNAGNIRVETQAPIDPNDSNITNGQITTGELLANSIDGDGGDIRITASGDIADIVTGNVSTVASVETNGLTVSGGDITIETPDTISTIGGDLLSEVDVQILAALGAGNGGNVTLRAGSDISTANISILTDGFSSDSGDIGLFSTGGNVDTSAGALVSSAAQGDGGDITLNAAGNLTFGTVDARGNTDPNAGDLTNGGALTFTAGQDITIETGSISTNNSFPRDPNDPDDQIENIEFNNNVILTGDIEINNFDDGNIIFNSPIDGAFDLSLNPGDGEIILNEIIGGTTPLTEFAFQGTLRAIIASGLDINTDQITLLGDAEISATAVLGHHY
jgi:hypothetical protein